MRILLSITFVFVSFCTSFNAASQLNYSIEFEAAPLFSNRSFTQHSSSGYGKLESHQSQSKFLPGFHFQAGINLRDDKKTRLFAGVKLLNQNVLVAGYFFYNSYTDGSGQLVLDGFATSTRTDMFYLTFPLMMKQTLLSKSDFRLVSEIGAAPGFLLGTFPSSGPIEGELSLFGEFAMSFEWKLKKGNMIGLKFPALTYSLLPNSSTYKNINQYNYSLALGLKLGIGNWNEPTQSTKKKIFKNEFSYEVEIAPVFSNHLISFNDKLFEHYNPLEITYIWAKEDFAEYSKLKSQFLPGGYFQFGINFREEKHTRFFIGMRVTEQRVLAIARPTEDSLVNSNGSTEYFRQYAFEQVRMGYLSIPVFLKQSIINKPSFRFGFEAGFTPGILIYDDSKPQYSRGKFAAIQTEFSFSFEKPLKNGNWIGIKIPTVNYSLLPNITRDAVIQHNYSIGMGIRYIFRKQ